MELKDWVATLLTVWSNTVATIALILIIREKKPLNASLASTNVSGKRKGKGSGNAPEYLSKN